MRALFEDPAVFDAWEVIGEFDWVERKSRQGLRSINGPGKPDLYSNHKVEEVLAAAVNHGNISEFQDMLSVVTRPFDEVNGRESYAGGEQTSAPYRPLRP